MMRDIKDVTKIKKIKQTSIRLKQVETELTRLKKKLSLQQRLLNVQKRTDTELKQMSNEIVKLKKQKILLVQQKRKENVVHRHNIETRQRVSVNSYFSSLVNFVILYFTS